ncbi:DUF1353 domain-containing protein [Oerskovia enterophila]|uniref:DUF1353 domain-containing protein n=1 Tax=Oerskovia enterophila TaxID=43678 RepID=UPI0037F785BE
MPFLAPLPDDPDRWTTATTVDLRQLPVTGRWKVWFEVLTAFGHSSRPADEQTADGPVWRRASVEQTVPAGLVTDLASVPMPLWGVIASYGRQTLPAILHDAASRELATSDAPASARRAARRDADHLFRATLRQSGTGPVRRLLMWAAVRLFGHLGLAITFLLSVVAGLAALCLDAAGTGTPWVLGAGTVAGGAAAALLVQAVLLGVESRPAPDRPRPRWVPGAVGSLLGAAATGFVALPLLLPLIVLTTVAELVVGAGEGGPGGVRAQGVPTAGLPATRITYTSPG